MRVLVSRPSSPRGNSPPIPSSTAVFCCRPLVVGLDSLLPRCRGTICDRSGRAVSGSLTPRPIDSIPPVLDHLHPLPGVGDGETDRASGAWGRASETAGPGRRVSRSPELGTVLALRHDCTGQGVALADGIGPGGFTRSGHRCPLAHVPPNENAHPGVIGTADCSLAERVQACRLPLTAGTLMSVLEIVRHEHTIPITG